MAKELSEMTLEELLEIASETDIEQLKNSLMQKGWGLMSSSKNSYMQMSFNKGYTKEGFAEKVYHLHVRYLGNWNELYFRDYLREHKEVAAEYGQLKLSLKEKYEHDRDGYTKAKTEFILKYSEKAKEEYADKYNPMGRIHT